MRLDHAVEDYLKTRRRLGFELRGAQGHLKSFVHFLQTEHVDHVSTELAMRWATQPTDVQPLTWAQRLGVVRRFAAWQHMNDPHTEVPPDGLLFPRYQRKPRYLYSDEEIQRLVQAARELQSPGGLRAQTYSTFFGLLAATGLRMSEALQLDCEDVNLTEGILAIRHTKFGKSRFVPLHPSTTAALDAYATVRKRLFPSLRITAFFVSERAARIGASGVRANFSKVARAIGLPMTGTPRPRLHDMRHRFAVRTLIDWYRQGLDVRRQLPTLSTYLGHTNAAATYWYLEAAPELLQVVAQRREEARS